MDQPGLDADRHLAALEGLRRINWLSRSGALFWPALTRLARQADEDRPLRVLDLATGGGDVPLRLARRARQLGLPIEFAACDKSARAVTHAADSAEVAGERLSCFVWDIGEGVPEGYDVLMCSLFLHHLGERQALTFLAQLRVAARRAILINDLLRTPLGFVFAWAGTRVLTGSSVVHVDSLLSVQSAFTIHEIRGMANDAGMASASLTKRWPERFLLEWYRA